MVVSFSGITTLTLPTARGNWSAWLKQQMSVSVRDRGGRQSVAGQHSRANRVIIMAGKLFHQWGEVGASLVISIIIFINESVEVIYLYFTFATKTIIQALCNVLV